MTKQELLDKKLPLGQFLSAKWKSLFSKGEDTYEKVSAGVVRLVEYAHIQSVSVAGKSNANEQHITKYLIYNEKTGKHYVQLATTNVKPTCLYYRNGEQITKEEYMAAKGGSHSHSASPIFRVFLDNLISIGE